MEEKEEKRDWIEEDKFDVIIVGTGFTQSLLAGLLYIHQKTLFFSFLTFKFKSIF